MAERFSKSFIRQSKRLEKSECAAIWFQNAVQAERSGRFEDARMGYYNSWREEPEEIRYYQELVYFLERHAQYNDLMNVYAVGVQLHPMHGFSYINYSNLLNHFGRYEEARAFAEQWLCRDAHSIDSWGNLGNAFRGLGELKRAEECFRKILKNEPEHPHAKFNLSQILLTQGCYKEAWPLYESRFELEGYQRLISRNHAPRWTGEDLDGRSILVYAEQGLGDTIMFCRFVDHLVRRGARVKFEVQGSLVWMLKGQFGPSVSVVARSDLNQPSEIRSDYQIPLMSLAGLLSEFDHEDFTLDSYLTFPVDNEGRANEWISSVEGYRVGLCWQGNPNTAIDCGRSMDLRTLEPLFHQPYAEFVSLQCLHGIEGLEEMADCNPNFHFLSDLDAEGEAFSETVRLIQGLDLVITTDTAIAHLAGAMGKQCWILLQKEPEWRWGKEGEFSRWYPQMRCFRQERAGDWEALIEKVACELADGFPIPVLEKAV